MKKLALVVDDDSDLRALNAMLLESIGYEVIQALDGEMGLVCFKENGADISVVVTDYDMPLLNGIKMCRQIRHLSQSVAIVLVSGDIQDECSPVAIEAIAAGADTTLGKPYRPQDLLTAVEKSTLKHILPAWALPD